jgi:uncharacterized protein (DUF2147 family)
MKTNAKIPALFFILFAFIALLATGQDTDGNKLEGLWIPGSGKAIVKIEQQNGVYNGKIIWLKNPNNEQGLPKTDRKNPDPAMQSRPVVGLNLLSGFTYMGNKLWSNGTIYDPENGKTYSCKITMVDENTLDVRGYIGISLIGRTDQWKRAQKKDN